MSDFVLQGKMRYAVTDSVNSFPLRFAEIASSYRVIPYNPVFRTGKSCSMKA